MTDPTQQASAPKSSVESTLLTLAVLGAVVLLLSIITFVPRSGGDASVDTVDTSTRSTLPDGSAPTEEQEAALGGLEDGGGGGQVGKTQGRVEGADPSRPLPVDASLDCKSGKNGGGTDVGVTKDSIKLGASIVDSGPGASFLHPVVTAMSAVKTKVNTNGGICGRKLTLSLHDSGWRADSGYEIIRNMVEGEKVFALAVNPDSEGLDLASARKYLSLQKVPVVGTDGLLISQYKDPYVWPVAAPTVSAMYAIAKSQCDSGLRNFSIVFEQNYRFGREGAKAYNLAAKNCTGSDIKGYKDPDTSQVQCAENFCGIQSAATSYNADVSKYCKTLCDAGALLLEPAAAQVWLANGGPNPSAYNSSKTPGALGTPQPLFSSSFAKQCDRACDGLRVWTGFLPPIEQFAQQPAVQRYVNEVKSFDPSIDTENQFVEGGYLGMQLVVKAIEAASSMPRGLTRANLVTVLNSMSNFDSGLTVEPLSWSAGNHYAQTTVHAFDEQYGETGFGGWRYTGLKVKDPDPSASVK